MTDKFQNEYIELVLLSYVLLQQLHLADHQLSMTSKHQVPARTYRKT